MHSKNVIVSHTNQPVAVIALHNPSECVCVCTAEEAFSTWLHLTDPSGHAFTDLLHLYASISWLRTMSRPANQALRTLRRVCRALGGGGDPMGYRGGGGRLWTLRKSLGDQWPHWCRAQKKLPTGMMSYFTCQPSSWQHSEESKTVKSTSCTWQLYLLLMDRCGFTYESNIESLLMTFDGQIQQQY